MRALVERIGGARIPREAADAALAGLGAPVAGTDFVRWSLAWLRMLGQKRAAA
jgi:hypothetical protein